MPILIKIGTSSSNDYVIHNPHVSGRHAEVTVFENGDVFIEDKGSTNGTFVGPNRTRLTPGQETKVRRGDLILLGNEPLNWGRIPSVPDNNGYKHVITIGSNFRNNIVVQDNSVSRYHATVKVDPKKRVYIVDNGSTNGTKVNGVKVEPHQLIRIKKGDNVMVGSQNITRQLAPYFPSNIWGKVALWAGSAAVVAAIVLAIIFLVPRNNDIPKNPKNAVAYVMHKYHYTLKPKENPWGLDLEFTTPDFNFVQGTAFFIDEKGRLGTALHVAKPWDQEFDPQMHNMLQKDWQSYLNATLPREVQNAKQLQYLLSTDIGQQIAEALERNGSRNPIADINAMLNILFRSELLIDGETEEIRIGYPGRMYSTFAEMEPVTVVAQSDDKNADVAILQLNTKQLPQGKEYFPIDKMYTSHPDIDKKETFHYMGFPYGIVKNLDAATKSLEPYVRQSPLAREPSKFYFEIQDESAGGASGSPVYNEENELAGILYAVTAGDAKTSQVIHASYLKNLYEKEFPEDVKNKK